jgi:hypothetical protein
MTSDLEARLRAQANADRQAILAEGQRMGWRPKAHEPIAGEGIAMRGRRAFLLETVANVPILAALNPDLWFAWCAKPAPQGYAINAAERQGLTLH